MKDVTSVK